MRYLFSCFFCLALVGNAGCDPGKPSKESSSQEFIELFDGKSLDGWKSSTDNPASFSVKDNLLIVKGGPAHLFYVGEVNQATFDDFELIVKLKTTPAANSGIYFHTAYQESGWPSAGYEAQVNASHKDVRKTGSLYGIHDIVVLEEGRNPPKDNAYQLRNEAPNRDGEWFEYRITVKGQRIRIQVNGDTTVDYNEPVGGPQKANFPLRQLSSGTFAIQAHDPDSEVHVERFAVRPL